MKAILLILTTYLSSCQQPKNSNLSDSETKAEFSLAAPAKPPSGPDPKAKVLVPLSPPVVPNSKKHNSTDVYLASPDPARIADASTLKSLEHENSNVQYSTIQWAQGRPPFFAKLVMDVTKFKTSIVTIDKLKSEKICKQFYQNPSEISALGELANPTAQSLDLCANFSQYQEVSTFCHELVHAEHCFDGSCQSYTPAIQSECIAYASQIKTADACNFKKEKLANRVMATHLCGTYALSCNPFPKTYAVKSGMPKVPSCQDECLKVGGDVGSCDPENSIYRQTMEQWVEKSGRFLPIQAGPSKNVELEVPATVGTKQSDF